jgi:hypothetical protein
VRWGPRKSRRPAYADRGRVLKTLADLSAENGWGFVPMHKVVKRLGRSPGLGAVIEDLIRGGLVERGSAADGGWGDRPTGAGYRELLRLNA